MKPVGFVNNIVKQGNSLCVRIPNTIIKELDLKEGNEIVMLITAHKNLYKYNEKTIQQLLKLSKRVKKLNGYNETTKRIFITFLFQYLDETTSPDKKEENKRQIKFVKEKRRELGSKFINEFTRFAQIFNKEAFIMENNIPILKPEYR